MSRTVMIVDDQPLFAQGLAMILETQGDLEVIGTPSDGREALAQIEEKRPDAVFLDLRMGTVSGLDVLAALRRANDATPVIVLTTLRQEHAVYESLRLGAAAFLTKDAEPQMLLTTLDKVLDGDTAVGAPELRRLMADHGSAPAGSVSVLPELTQRERTVFLLCARGLDNQAIAENECVGIATVKSQVSAILRKLGLTSRVQIPIYAYEHHIVEPRAS
jgi:DNA-binding NarL/FixJ family response regulator